MVRATHRFGGALVNAMFALAAFFFVFAPTMDALAKEDALQASPSVVERVLAAFDMLDDVLVHQPGHAPVAHQHHIGSAVQQTLSGRAITLAEHRVKWALASDAP